MPQRRYYKSENDSESCFTSASSDTTHKKCSSASTIDAIDKCSSSSSDSSCETCEKCHKSHECECDSSESKCCSQSKYDPGVSYFCSLVTPMCNVESCCSKRSSKGNVEFRMRRKNKTVTVQWEPFSGTLAASGIPYLTVSQSICNLPPYIITNPIYIEYKGDGRNTRVEIDPHSKCGNIRFYLNTDGRCDNTVSGDAIKIFGGSATWIVD